MTNYFALLFNKLAYRLLTAAQVLPFLSLAGLLKLAVWE
jgi:hypothetical protein